jgi:hypothetical protein
MKDELAERLLAKVMGWDPAEVTRERPILQDMARYKYDEYQQFEPGERFIESLARWLLQFEKDERAAAYGFVRRRVVFLSGSEMRHLVGEAFPTLIRPRILGLAAEMAGLSGTRVKEVWRSKEYKLLLRQTLFLGLSDGAHTDVFRRENAEISNEQIWHAYDFSEAKARSLGEELKKDVAKLLEREPRPEEARFRLVCLLDDFMASGRTYVRPGKDGNETGGKIASILRRLRNQKSALAEFLDLERLETLIVIYVASSQAVDYLKTELPKLERPGERLALKVVHRLAPEVRLEAPGDAAILELAAKDRYFDGQAETEATRVGGDKVRFGFSDCRLPLVLSHNTPNNSIYLLWAEPWHNVRGLFPRVSRHRDYA